MKKSRTRIYFLEQQMTSCKKRWSMVEQTLIHPFDLRSHTKTSGLNFSGLQLGPKGFNVIHDNQKFSRRNFELPRRSNIVFGLFMIIFLIIRDAIEVVWCPADLLKKVEWWKQCGSAGHFWMLMSFKRNQCYIRIFYILKILQQLILLSRFHHCTISLKFSRIISFV